MSTVLNKKKVQYCQNIFFILVLTKIFYVLVHQLKENITLGYIS